MALLTQRSGLVPWALLLAGAAAAIAFFNDADPARAPLYAAALLAAAEFAYWSLEERLSRPAVPGLTVRRLGLIFGLVAGSLVVGVILSAVARVEAGGGLVLETAGVAAVVGAAALLLLLSRRPA